MLRILLFLVFVSGCSKKDSVKKKEVKQKTDKKVVIKEKTNKKAIIKNKTNDKTIINEKTIKIAPTIKQICTKQFADKPEKLKACMVKLTRKKLNTIFKNHFRTDICLVDKNKQYKTTISNDLSCNKDSDCIVRGDIQGNCCAKCNQHNVYSKKTYNKILIKKTQCCKNIGCPEYKCKGTPYIFTAKCKNKKCILIKTKR
jgi:hypothetical protein